MTTLIPPSPPGMPLGLLPDDHTPTTAFRAGSDKHEHDDQDRRTT
ncbi:hypothetical protein ACGFYM_12135 [Streptomyces sp. NPDC048231]